MKPLLAVIVEGGMVQDVVSDGEPPDVEVIVIDYDKGNLTEEEEKKLVRVLQADGSSPKAHAWCEHLHPAMIDLGAVARQVRGVRERDPDDFSYLSDVERQAIRDQTVETCIDDFSRDDRDMRDFIRRCIDGMTVSQQLAELSSEEECQRELLDWNPRVQCSECRAQNLDACTSHAMGERQSTD